MKQCVLYILYVLSFVVLTISDTFANGEKDGSLYANKGKETYEDGGMLSGTNMLGSDDVDKYLQFANPMTKGYVIRFNVPTDQPYVYEIFDLLGKRISKHVFDVDKGFQHVEISTDNLQPGIYFLKVVGNRSSYIKRFVVE